jgi:hypothetical protein
VLLTGQTGTHRSDRSNAVAPPSSVLRSCLCWSTKEPNGFLVNHRKPRELGVASANRHSWLVSHVVPARPWFWGSTKKPSMTSSCCSSHHVARTWPRWSPGPSNKDYLSSPHLEAIPAMTFRACSSPTPTLVKPQPVPVILRQESVHTMLSITHHTRKRPSTSPRTTHGPQILSSPRTVCLLTLTSGPMSKAMIVSEPASHLLAIGSGRAGNDYLFYIGCSSWHAGPPLLFLNWNLLL